MAVEKLGFSTGLGFLDSVDKAKTADKTETTDLTNTVLTSVSCDNITLTESGYYHFTGTLGFIQFGVVRWEVGQTVYSPVTVDLTNISEPCYYCFKINEDGTVRVYRRLVTGTADEWEEADLDFGLEYKKIR